MAQMAICAELRKQGNPLNRAALAHRCAVMMPAFMMFMCSPPTGSSSLQR